MAARVRWRGTTTQRGYNWAHKKLRRETQKLVDRGEAFCTAKVCYHQTRWIPPGALWDLGHTADRTAYHGPEHRRCNRTDGAHRGNLRRLAIAAATRQAAPTTPVRNQSRW